MNKFLEKLNEEAEKLAKMYLSGDFDTTQSEIILEEIDTRLSILANAQALKTNALTAEFTQQMQEQAKNIDVSKIDFNSLFSQVGNFNAK